MDQISLGTGNEPGLPEEIVLAAQDASRVSGLTHGFYRYPARFSPVFARAAIAAFTKPGDWVFDPFAGGGTTLVEAMAAGRNALGIDISALAAFVCEAKTLIMSDQDVGAFQRWRERLSAIINMHAPARRCERYAEAGYFRNIDGRSYWRLRKAIEQCLESVDRLRCAGAKKLARCTVLRAAQWALDARKSRPSVAHFRSELQKHADAMLKGALAFRTRIESLDYGGRPRSICLQRNAAGAELEELVAQTCPPKLILTSPPYPGIHILYHRWQVDGRRESPAPFWIAGKLDGAGSSYYTMGDRKNPGLNSYFENLEGAFRSIARMAGPETMVVQMVAFSEAEWQLPRYLEVMSECGLREKREWGITEGDGRLWRDVPNRKWHADQKPRSPGAREVVLVHRLEDARIKPSLPSLRPDRPRQDRPSLER